MEHHEINSMMIQSFLESMLHCQNRTVLPHNGIVKVAAINEVLNVRHFPNQLPANIEMVERPSAQRMFLHELHQRLREIFFVDTNSTMIVIVQEIVNGIIWNVPANDQYSNSTYAETHGVVDKQP